MSVALIMTNSRGGLISLLAEIVFLIAVAGFRRSDKKRNSPQKTSRFKTAAIRAGLALAMIVVAFGTVTWLGETMP